MRRYNSIITVLLLSAAVHLQGFSQDPAIRLRQWSEKSGGEKVYLHLNRTDLLCGEVMWFNFFAVDQTSHKSSRVSQVGYVEVLDRKGESLLQTAVFLDNGCGSGSIYLPATLSTGNYLVRGFTQWMKNQDPAFAFTQQVTIVNTLKTSTASPVNSSPGATSIRFFPEGGNLVFGISAQVAFHAVRADGTGVSVKGWVIRDAADTVAAFRTVRNGLGKFTFRPLAGQTYRVAVMDDHNRRIAAELPEPQLAGVAMQVSDTLSNSIRIRLNSSSRANVTVLVHSRQAVRYSRKIEVGINPVGSDILVDRAGLSEGISHITVFDGADQPVAERLVFRRPEQTKLEVEASQAIYTIRGQAKLKLSLPGSGKYSVSVYRSDSAQQIPGIVEQLLLTSDLRGAVEDPAFCFSDDPMAGNVADLLMMTHGWRRFRWSAVLEGKPNSFAYLPEVRGHLLKAILLDTADRPVAGRNAFLSGPGHKARLYVGQSDSSGVVWFDLRRHSLGNRLYIQPDLRVDSLLKARVESPFTWILPVWNPRPVRIPLNAATELTRRSIAVQAADIYRESETFFTYKPVPRDTVPFYGAADELYNLDDYTRFPALEEVLREYVRGIYVRRREGHFRLRALDRPANKVFEENPLVMIDGVPYPDMDRLMEVDPLRIRKMEVVTRRYYLGPLRIPGILSLYTYAGDMAGLRGDPRAAMIDYESLERQREFAYPAYDSPQARASRLPDPRYQLWFGRVTDMGSTISFTTSDVEGRFRVVVEGLTDEGRPVSGGGEFRVER